MRKVVVLAATLLPIGAIHAADLYTPPVKANGHETVCSVANLHPTSAVAMDARLIDAGDGSELGSAECGGVDPGSVCQMGSVVGADTVSVYCKFTVYGMGKQRVRGGMSIRDTTSLQIITAVPAS